MNTMANRFDGLTQTFSRYRKNHQTLGELNMLGDRELRDLGISRSELRSIARAAAYGG